MRRTKLCAASQIQRCIFFRYSNQVVIVKVFKKERRHQHTKPLKPAIHSQQLKGLKGNIYVMLYG